MSSFSTEEREERKRTYVSITRARRTKDNCSTRGNQVTYAQHERRMQGHHPRQPIPRNHVEDMTRTEQEKLDPKKILEFHVIETL